MNLAKMILPLVLPLVLALPLALLSPIALVHAGPPSAPVQAEIDALLQRLVSSGCEFNRNGTWYSAAEAKGHLLTKLKYLADHGTVRSTEQFIDLAASGSSLSGKPYLVRCAGSNPVPSGQWLKDQLPAIRTAPQAAPPKT